MILLSPYDLPLESRCFIIQSFVKKYGLSVLFPGILSVAILYFILQPNDPRVSETELITTIPLETEQHTTQVEQEQVRYEEELNHQVLVDIKGAVKSPGVYELDSNDRIIDAIDMAGGFLDGAQTEFVNLSQKVQDEMLIYIPKKGESLDDVNFGQVVTTPSSKPNGTQAKVNINLADETELTSLPGIGPSKAQAIISFREENGQFKTIDELKNVSGIGDKTFEKLKEFISIK
nr:helix-hairpin-helix domain-containing protein [Lysinibacillus timonensis]